MSLAVVGIGEKLLIIDDEKVQPYVSFSSLSIFYILATTGVCRNVTVLSLSICQLDKLETTMGGRQVPKDAAEVRVHNKSVLACVSACWTCNEIFVW